MPLVDNVTKEFKYLRLADPAYYNPTPIDILLAGELFPYIYGEKKNSREQGSPVTISSVFGYVILDQTEFDLLKHNYPAPSIGRFYQDGNSCAVSMNVN